MDEQLSEINQSVKEIRDALIGTYEKPGLISRVAKLEAVVKSALIVLGGVVTTVIASMFQ